ncbi:hypothetical protein Bca52824_010231 [Brassica carinata]|uniref:Uncharacterized protein n=1 Tax=Brassica carinata TaxID=52824 RepID=A0A8X8BAN3_BRACI|nr:hypothetical protein Bca52824_010231 [Brassica carinata]
MIATRDLAETKGRQRSEGGEDRDPELPCEIIGQFLRNHMRKVEVRIGKENPNRVAKTLY